MSKPSFFSESCGRRILSIVTVSILLLIPMVSEGAPSQKSGATDRQEVFRRLVESYVQAGKAEYEKGYFAQAVKTFQMAQGYQEYLTADGREQVRALLEKAQTAVTQRKRALEIFQTVNKLIKQDQLGEAKNHLESLKDNTFLTKKEHAQITEVLKQIDVQIAEDKAHSKTVQNRNLLTTEKLEKIAEALRTPNEAKSDRNEQIAELYRRSMKFYRAGQFEKAREGLMKVADSGLIPPAMRKTIEGYLKEIDKVLPRKAGIKPSQEQEKTQTEMAAVIKPKVVEPEGAQPELAEPKLTASESEESELVEPEIITTAPEQNAAEPTTVAESPPSDEDEESYIDQVVRTRNILRNYTQTVVNNAITTARNHMGQGEFDKAKKIIEMAQYTVTQNQIHLGDALFDAYRGRLNIVDEEITQQQKEKVEKEAEEKRAAAAEAQRKFREQMETDRQNKIAQLMENARTYQKQQRYEAALGQLESLLALDPQHDEALTLKATLEDTIFWRKQLAVEKESNKQRAELFVKTDESLIPYADELTYPKNWREIVDKPTRQPEKPIGLDPVDANVYERLEQMVDLPDLTPEMSFADVITALENSVSPPLQIQPNWKDLSEMGEVEPDTPAGMDPLSGVKVRKALEVLLAGVSSEYAPLNYVVDEGVIQIATTDTLPDKLVPRVYDITDLVGEPAQYGGMQGMMMGRMMGMMGGMGGGMMGGYGGGMGGGMMGGYGGGMGGMGGYGGGMGGMGGYGGGMGGMGGYGGGMMGGGYGGGMGGGTGIGRFIAQDLTMLIQDSTGWENWAELSETGEGGEITPYPTQQPKKLAVLATHEVHIQIESLLDALRKALGHQVSIEARFLVVSENFLEDIGLDVDFNIDAGTKWGQITFEQDSALAAGAEPTQVPLTLGGIGQVATMTAGYGNILDDLQVAFLLRATQAHRDAKQLTAPMASVLSGESANFNISRQLIFALPPIQQGGITQTGAVGGTTTTTGQGNVPQYLPVQSGSMLSITPTITHDKKNVLLNIITVQNDFLGLRTSVVEAPIVGGAQDGEVQTWRVQLPDTETSSLMTRVSVPDGGTLLLGGQKISAEVEKEAGVPILSKIPIVGRLFGNRSTVRDQKILLILVKPIILLQEEREAEAIAALENQL